MHKATATQMGYTFALKSSYYEQKSEHIAKDFTSFNDKTIKR